MVVLKATLPFALAILITGSQALLERKPIKQELPPVDKGCCGCKNFGNDQSGKDNAVAAMNCYFNLHILKTINLLKHLLNPSIVRPSKSDQDIKPGMPIDESLKGNLQNG